MKHEIAIIYNFSKNSKTKALLKSFKPFKVTLNHGFTRGFTRVLKVLNV